MSEMEKENNGLGQLFVQEFIKAGAWGIVFLLVAAMLIFSIKDEIKQGIAFGVDRLATDIVLVGSNREVVDKFKEILKESLDYSLQRAAKEAKNVMNDTTIEIKFNPKPDQTQPPKKQELQ